MRGRRPRATAVPTFVVAEVGERAGVTNARSDENLRSALELHTRPDGDCVVWTAARTKRGYGMFAVGANVWRLAHRVSYELARGPVPEGLTLDHLCRNRACVNPNHLEPVTLAENISRAWAARRVEVANGVC